MRMMTARAIRLPDRFYLPRTDTDGREVRDVMPWEGAVSYATDGERLGVQYGDGRVEWLGRAERLSEDVQPQSPPADPLRTFADDFDGVNMDALVDGIRSYIDLHPVLKTVWHKDVQTLETLREKAHEAES
ncbi:MAG TPA: hypothetical protein VEX86_04645 [Longimicrobium sp.]|nr:hypothetical protein [Longimicrobium sp.]